MLGRRGSLRTILPRLMALSLLFGVVTTIAPNRSAPSTAVHEQVLDVQGMLTAGADLLRPLRLDAEMVGISWTGSSFAAFQVRARTGDHWTEWLDMDGSPAEQPDAHSPRKQLTSAGPAWLAHDFRTVEVKVTAGTISGVQLHALDTESADGGGLSLGPDGAGAAVTPPFIIPRAQWGADESWRNQADGCEGYPLYTTNSGVSFAVVHHTVNSNDYSPSDSAGLIRGIYYFHTHSNGWCDIGYNFLVDRFGQIFEGRYGGVNRPVLGGHAGGFNAGSTGVAMLGDYDAAPVPAAAYGALVQLLGWKLAYHGVDPLGTVTHTVAESDCNCQRWPVGTTVTLPTIIGHRDVDSTGCPGQYLYALLPQLRQDVWHIVFDPANADQRLVCDWNGDGFDSPAAYQHGTFYIRNSNDEGAPDLRINYGADGYVPVCGDWNGDGTDTIGVYVNGWWYLRNSNTPGLPDLVVHYGSAIDTPVVGNWDGVTLPHIKGDGIGVYEDGAWYLRNTVTPGAPDRAFAFGVRGYQPVVGHWRADRKPDGIGVFVGGNWYTRVDATPGPSQLTVDYGLGTDHPLAGDWDGDGDHTPAVARGSYWFERDLFQGPPTDVFPF
jgi:hypothetical protein